MIIEYLVFASVFSALIEGKFLRMVTRGYEQSTENPFPDGRKS
jgi:hypothetical protein